MLGMTAPLISCVLFDGVKAQKFCGRDYGDRVHWTPVPRWFDTKECSQLNQDAVWSDLYVACYSRTSGFAIGEAKMIPPIPNDCRWTTFRPDATPPQ